MFGFKLIKVTGHSMEPALKAGSFALIKKSGDYKVGDVILFTKDSKPMLKRISKIENDLYYLLGDNPSDSYDSSDFGWIPKNKIYGKVIWK